MARMNIVKLKDVTNIITGYPFKSTLYTDHMPAVRLLRGDNIVQGRVRWENVKLYPTDEIKDLSDYELAIDDVVIAMDRPWIEAGLKHAQINKNDTPAYLVQRVARLRAKKIINKQYLKYIIGSSNFANYIVGAQTGTAIPHISKQIISNYEFELPPIEVQDKISSLVQLFDKKIELNRQMNETLEQMAQAVFQDWFVDFGPVKRKLEGINDPVAILGGLIPDPIKAQKIASLFPDQFADDGLPEGWEVKGLDQVADFLNGLALQKFPALHNDDFLPVIKIAELRNGVSANSGKANTNIPEKFIIDDKDFIFSWSGSLLAKFWTEGKGALNQHLFKVTSTEYPHWFFSQWVYHYLKDFQQIAAAKATTMGHIQRKHLSSALVNCPSHGDIKRFGLVLSPITDLIISNNIQNHTLAEMRDLLLPKLMSGEISVDELEKKMGGVL